MSTRTNDWRSALRRGLVSGSIGSLLSTAALMICGKLEGRSAAAPVNAPSQWLWGRRAAHRRHPSARDALLGYAIHHAAACGWAVLHERCFGAAECSRAARFAQAGAVAALACFVDYRVTPKRLRPGFEVQLSRPSLAAVYATFAVGLAIAATRPARARGPERDRAPGVRRD